MGGGWGGEKTLQTWPSKEQGSQLTWSKECPCWALAGDCKVAQQIKKIFGDTSVRRG